VRDAINYYAGKNMVYRLRQANDALTLLRAGKDLGDRPFFIGE
jgi:hypothetical protein